MHIDRRESTKGNCENTGGRNGATMLLVQTRPRPLFTFPKKCRIARILFSAVISRAPSRERRNGRSSRGCTSFVHAEKVLLRERASRGECVHSTRGSSATRICVEMHRLKFVAASSLEIALTNAISSLCQKQLTIRVA